MATILASNFLANTLSGTVSVVNGFANVNLATLPFALEGDKPFVIKLRKGSIQGDVISTSPVITLKDNSSVVSLTANVSTLSEGNLVSFTLVTANAANGANVFYSVFPVTANVTVSDFFGGNTGLITINDNQATFALYANTDAGYVDETGEIFNLQLRTVSPQGNAVYTTSNITILDAYKLYNVLGFAESASTIAEGSSVTITFTGHNIPLGTTLYYSTEGNATSSLFTTGNTGSFIMNTTSNTITLTTTSTVPSGETRSFAVKLREGSSTGTLYATSNTITVVDSSLAYMSASGGTIIDEGGYRIHAFITSGNITVTSLGAGPAYNTIDYLAVAGGAGGGGGGGTFSSQYTGGGGGGAGGLLTSNITFTSTGTTTIAIGAGGAGSTGYGDNTPGKSGGNTIISIGGGTTLTAFGGGGGQGGDINIPAGSGNGYGRPGGSGGGTAKVNAYGPSTAGTGIAGQGNPGGVSSPVTAGGVAEDRAGGGGGGAGAAGSWKSGDPTSAPTSTQSGGIGRSIDWVPVSYGTPGPAPGRYFAGGGGGGGHPAGSAYLMSGGAGGGGAGGYYSPGYPTSAYLSGAVINAQDSGANATINTGGGGGGVGNAGASTGYGRSGKGGSGIVLIRYPYVPPPSFGNVTTTSSAFVEGSNVTFTINVSGANAYTYYYTTVGNVTASDFVGGNTGTFTANTTGAVVTLQINSSIPENETRYFALQIREDSLTGAIKATSSNVNIVDVASYYVNATGGTVSYLNDYKIHTFTTSGNLIVSSAGYTTAEVLVVAGGGGGGSTSGGGGGGGGLLYGNIALVSQNYAVMIGAGGSAGYDSPPGFTRGGGKGGNTILGTYIALGGGAGGGNYGGGSTPGGSGGGSASGSSGAGAGNQGPSNGLVGYGYPGGGTPIPSAPSQSGGGGGARGAGGVTSFSTPTSFAAGGTGFYTTITGSNVTYSEGGRGYSPSFPSQVNNTGRGGDGSGSASQTPAQLGAPGVVVVRYPYPVRNIEATGGNVTLLNGYKTHVFTSSDTFIIDAVSPSPAKNTIEYMVVAGGGGGGAYRSGFFGQGGGGAGGFVRGNVSIASNTTVFAVTVGGGGGGAIRDPASPTFYGVNTPASSGTDSAFANTNANVNVTAKGGGAWNVAGGSGGGNGAAGFGYPSPTQQGYPGASGSVSAGGGAGAAGSVGTGGIGKNFDTPTFWGDPGPGPGRYFAGGGGGAQPNPAPGTGGIGGGGMAIINSAGLGGNIYTGGGGAGAWDGPGNGGSGGSGIVVIRYPYN